MARKVFLSVLGTGFYDKCVYSMGEFRSPQTRFIQEATIRMLSQQSEWTENDHIYIVITDKAETDNWIVKDNIRKHYKTKQEEEYIGLHDVLAEMNLKTPVSTIKIPDGNNEDEIWQMFENIYNVLQKDDRLFFDLTHAFRYIPMLVLVLGNYAKFLKDVKKESITYGKYDTQGATEQEGTIINITSIATLQDWTYAAADYLNHGDATKLSALASTKLSPILRNRADCNVAAQNLNNISKSLDKFCNSLLFSRGMDIVKSVDVVKLQEMLDSADNGLIKPMSPLLAEIKKSVIGFKKNATANMIYAARLCFEQENYQSAITLLREGIISILCNRYNVRLDNEKEREAVKSGLYRHLYPSESGIADKMNPTTIEIITERVAHDTSLTRTHAKLFDDIATIRNDFNHAGMNDNRKRCADLKDAIEQYLNDTFQYFVDVTPRPSLLLNLSNHPYADWDDVQKQAALSYGECRDMPFPQIDPTIDTKQIIQMADEYVGKIEELSHQYNLTVHVMGEMSFTYRVVTRLTALGIRCICSTSRRDTYINDKGDKVVSFNFRRFRDYTV